MNTNLQASLRLTWLEIDEPRSHIFGGRPELKVKVTCCQNRLMLLLYYLVNVVRQATSSHLERRSLSPKKPQPFEQSKVTLLKPNLGQERRG